MALHRSGPGDRRSRSTALADFAASHCTTDRAARNGTMRSMPSSVSFCTTSSGLSPFTRANPTDAPGPVAGRPRRARSPRARRPSRAGRQRPRAVADGERRARSEAEHPDQVVEVGVGQLGRVEVVDEARTDRGDRPGAPPAVATGRRSGSARGSRRRPLRPRRPAASAYWRRRSSCSGVEVGGHADRDPHDEVAALAALEVGHPEAPQPELLAGLGAPREHDRLRAVEGLQLELGPQCRLGEGHGEVAAQVGAIAREPGVGGAPGRGRRGRRWPRRGARPRPVPEPQRRAGVDAGGDVDRVGPLLDDPSVAAAVRARLGDHLAGAARSAGRPRS